MTEIPSFPQSALLRLTVKKKNALVSHGEYTGPLQAGPVLVKEVFLKGKKSARDNEDGIYVGRDFVAVVDGATSKSDTPLFEGKPGGMAMLLTLSAIHSLPPWCSWPEALVRLTAALQTFFAGRGLVERLKAHPEERPTASAVIYSRYRHEIWMVGDCQCLVGQRLFTNAKVIDDIMARARAAYDHALLQSGEATLESLLEDDPGRAFIMPFLKRQGFLQNCPGPAEPYAFSVLDGFPVPLERTKVISLGPCNEVVLASDGYPYLCDSLELTERHLKALLKNDPLCIGSCVSAKGLVKGNVSFDDRAYIRFTVLRGEGLRACLGLPGFESYL